MSELTDDEREALESLAGCGCCSSETKATTLWPDDCPTDEYGYQRHTDDALTCTTYLLVCIERILAARRAEWRKEGEAIARGMVEQALREQREQIAAEIEEAIEPDHDWPSDWRDCFGIGVNRAVALVRGGE